MRVSSRARHTHSLTHSHTRSVRMIIIWKYVLLFFAVCRGTNKCLCSLHIISGAIKLVAQRSFVRSFVICISSWQFEYCSVFLFSQTLFSRLLFSFILSRRCEVYTVHGLQKAKHLFNVRRNLFCYSHSLWDSWCEYVNRCDSVWRRFGAVHSHSLAYAPRFSANSSNNNNLSSWSFVCMQQVVLVVTK